LTIQRWGINERKKGQEHVRNGQNKNVANSMAIFFIKRADKQP